LDLINKLTQFSFKISDEKLSNALLIKLNTILIDDNLDENLIPEFIKILNELTQSERLTKQLSKVIFDTKSVLEKSRKMKQKFMCMAEDDEIFKGFSRLLNLKQDKCTFFPLLCQLFYKLLKVRV
jgi:uncharacterized protein YabN with tetrapyrrole methylase and pyrophosphatase domain